MVKRSQCWHLFYGRVYAEHQTRKAKSGDGVSLLIKNNIGYTLREDLSLNNDNIESLFIEIDKSILGKKQNSVIGVVYRPPNTDINSFNDYISKIKPDVTKFEDFQADYSTKGDLKISTFSSGDKVMAAVSSGKIGGVAAYYNLEDLSKVKDLIVKAKAKIQEVK